MKKAIYSIFISLLLISCGDLDELNLNPDKPSTVTPDFIATKAILKITNEINFFYRTYGVVYV